MSIACAAPRNWSTRASSRGRNICEFRKAEDFLWAVRCHMHFLTGKAEERLHFDIQRDIAERLGYTDRPGLSAVERFMKHYFLTAKTVGDLTRILCAALEEEHAKHVPGFNRIFLTFQRRRRKLAGTSDFIVDNHRINIADEHGVRARSRSTSSGCSGSPTGTGWNSIPTR